jgi:hypothetical protein
VGGVVVYAGRFYVMIRAIAHNAGSWTPPVWPLPQLPPRGE